MIPHDLRIKSVGLYVNSASDADYRHSAAVSGFLSRRGVDVRLIGDGTALQSGALGLAEARAGGVDCVVTLGGDGSLLRAARLAAPSATPVMGINLGRLGYLTDTGFDGYEASLGRLLDGGFTLERRIMLTAETDGKPFIALNEAFVSRSGPARTMTLRVEINGDHMDTYQADGVLVSTPTGSTAYNLSAGGPVIKPDAELLAITPVCPHALHVRSSVISASDVVTVHVLSALGELFMDGSDAAAITRGGFVDIRRSPYYTTIVKTRNKGFYDILREKMNWS